MTGVFPTDWKTAKVIPIHKSGTRSNFDNFRPSYINFTGNIENYRKDYTSPSHVISQ
jgi:hypothetical protein